jgi:hypothetical protein
MTIAFNKSLHADTSNLMKEFWQRFANSISFIAYAPAQQVSIRPVPIVGLLFVLRFTGSFVSY